MAALSFLDRNRSIAKPGFSRWLVPPAALSIHLAIGQVYAFSVFKKPLNYLVQVSTVGGGLKALPGVDSPNLADWKFTDLGWIFSIAIVFLGLSAAIFGKWLEKAGPRKAMFASAVCFASGFFVSAIGVQVHQLWLIYLGYGVIGGIGLGLGYISPVSTLIKWFPDRPGMATGMAIMGFGGGALIGSPLATNLMAAFRTDHDLGVEKTFLVMGAIYFVAMMFGVFTVRVPEAGWKPEGWVAPAKPKALVTTHSVEVNTAFGTPQFWMLWIVLCMNVTAGIGILEQASPMIQELFKGKITAAAAGGFVALLSLFNMGGRFVWSSISDYIGRKNTYFAFFILGGILYYLAPHAGVSGWNSIPLFVGYLRRDSHHVRRRFRHHPCLPARSVRNHGSRRDSWPASDRVVCGRRFGSGIGELHSRIPEEPRRSAGRRIFHRSLCDGWIADGWLGRKCVGTAG